MASKLTQAFETYIRDSVINHTPVIFDEFIFANIPGLSDDNLDSHLTIPQENQIVHRQEVSQIGALNENAIVYSVTIGTEIGDFDFNWVGLVNKSQNLLACGIFSGLTSKVKNREQKQGNSITRSVLLEFPRAQELANVSVSAETWQIDFTMRLSGIDEKIRLTNRDLYGRAVFFDNAFLLKRKSGNVYTLDSGYAYIEGVRAEIKRTAEVTVPTLPASVYVDICHHATVTGAYQTEIKYLTKSKNDYVGSDGYQHYVQIIADIASNGTITDRRLTDNAPPYIAESKKSSSVSSTSEKTVATSKAVKTAYDKAVEGVNKAQNAQTAAWNAQQSATNADNNANNRVAKTGDTVTGTLYLSRGSKSHRINNFNWSLLLEIDPNLDSLIGSSQCVIGFNGNGSLGLGGNAVDGWWAGINKSGLSVAKEITEGITGKKLSESLPISWLVGMPFAYPLSSVPAGFLAMQGQAFDKSRYPILAQRYPSGRLPDMRGEFIRGWDNGRGMDSGRALLSSQDDAFQDHYHALPTSNGDDEKIDAGISHVISDNNTSTIPQGGFYDVNNTRYAKGNNTGINSANITRTYSILRGEFRDWHSDKGLIAPKAAPKETRPRNIAFQYICLAA